MAANTQEHFNMVPQFTHNSTNMLHSSCSGGHTRPSSRPEGRAEGSFREQLHRLVPVIHQERPAFLLTHKHHAKATKLTQDVDHEMFLLTWQLPQHAVQVTARILGDIRLLTAKLQGQDTRGDVIAKFQHLGRG